MVIIFWDIADYRNEGDLSSKYYDPELIRKRRHSSHSSHERHRTHSPEKSRTQTSAVYPRHSKIVGPTLPSREDLQLQKGILSNLNPKNRTTHRRCRRSRSSPLRRTESPTPSWKRTTWWTCSPCWSRHTGTTIRKACGDECCDAWFQG